MIETENHGPLIVSTDFWESEWEREGKLYVSCNGGAFRLLLPSRYEVDVIEMATAKEVIVSRGPWKSAGLTDGFELLFDDGSESPYSLHLHPDSFDRFPTAENAEREWVFTAWTKPRRGRPHKALERVARYRIVDEIPCLKPWQIDPTFIFPPSQS